MKRSSSLIFMSLLLSNSFPLIVACYAKNNPPPSQNTNQMRQINVQQEQARAVAEQNARAAAERAVRQQEEMALRAQQENMQKQQQQQMQRAQELAVKAQQVQQQRMQEQAIKAQQQEQRQEQQEAVKVQQQEQRREQQEAVKVQEREQEQLRHASVRPEEQHLNNEEPMHAAMVPTRNATMNGVQEHNIPDSFNPDRIRPIEPKSLGVKSVPIKKALSMPVLEANLTAEEREHADNVVRNLQTHLVPVEATSAPANIPAVTRYAMNHYLNNYATRINNQPIIIDRQNTFVNTVPQFQYPYWYQPQPGWIFSNGFSLGNVMRVGTDWLGWGWHPYYGPSPEGFVCASDYVPTPWVYVPAYGLWRQPGIEGWAPFGPPYDYTGPITVEVLEPRHVRVSDTFTNFTHERMVNVVYLYNAFFYPELERWGYTNRHDYFILVNV